MGNEDVDCVRLVALCSPAEGCSRWVGGLVGEEDVDASINGDAHVGVVVLFCWELGEEGGAAG